MSTLTLTERVVLTRAARAAAARERQAIERSHAVLRARWAALPPNVQADVLEAVRQRLGRPADPANVFSLVACLMELDRPGRLEPAERGEMLPF